MDYTYVEPPQNANSGWMGHHIKLFVDRDKRDSFWAFLENYCGPCGEQWRVANKQELSIWGDPPLDLRFQHKKHAMIVKLQWEEDEDPIAKAIDQIKAISSRYTFPMSQSIGRGIRNAQMTCVKPRNPLPWISSSPLMTWDELTHLNSTAELVRSMDARGVGASAIIVDEASEAPVRPVWHVDKCRERGDEISTTAMVEARLAGSTSLPALLPVRSGE